MDKVSWSSLEYEHREKTPDWYWALGIVALSTAVISIIFRNYIFAVFILLASGILAMFSSRPAETMRIEINGKGIKIKDEFYPYKMIRSFWIEDQGKEKKLLINAKRVVMPIMALPLPDSMEEQVRSALAPHLRQEEMREPVSQRIMEYFGF